ncbi:uncharacterized protein LOC118433634 [Folsomia candida]|uniref:uncharacterized protein LOC118433557 n=1 Tax=Folsomia candida TaxID=158441 RepID=UPI001604F6A6|nr:uncharacterized protein LOC118433557 [Folsomia candida]XP_035701678.1 uncharacterized protein LOC118433634 [Folsomia candida]
MFKYTSACTRNFRELNFVLLANFKETPSTPKLQWMASRNPYPPLHPLIMKFTFDIDITCFSIRQMKLLAAILGILIVSLVQFCWSGPPTIFFFTFTLLSLTLTLVLLLGEACRWKRYCSDLDNVELGFFLCGGLAHILCAILMVALKGNRWEGSYSYDQNTMKNSITAYVSVIGILNGILYLIIAARTYRCSGTRSDNDDCEELAASSPIHVIYGIGRTDTISSAQVGPPPPYADAVQAQPTQFM